MTTWQAITRMATPPTQPLSSIGQDAAPNGSFRVAGASSTPAFVTVLRPLAAHAASAWRWLEHRRTQQLSTRRLRVTETVQLGEKRFVSILHVDGAQFLIGGAGGNVSLLATLKKTQDASAADDWTAALTTQESGS